ncbi:MAG TPA: PLP-dependent aminotransferase family protein [Gaiellaceae bacterium]|nr:PLP-dependent aminotransferase family protein [Gaiellaceae bacterium]
MEPLISFARGVPAPDCLPGDELADCARTVLDRDGKTILSYGSGAGYAPLRELLAEWFKVHPHQVILTNGSLQGFVMLAQHYGRGQTVFVESPTYDRPLKILLENAMTVVPMKMDDHGLLPDEFEAALRGNPDPAFVYMIPTFQNPSGRTLPEDRRRQIVGIAEAADALLVEDDPYGLIRFEGEPQPALFDISGRTTIYTSSFSKTIAPGLRVGWFLVPESLAAPLIDRANSTYITPVLLSQAVVHEFIRRGSFEPNLVRINGLLKERRDAMLAALEKHFAGASWSRPEGGYFVWLELPAGTNAEEVLERAEGVTAVLGTDFGGTPNTIRLAYSYVSPDEIDEGVGRLAVAV